MHICNDLRKHIVDYIKSVSVDNIYRSCNLMGDEWIEFPNGFKIGFDNNDELDYFIEIDNNKIGIDRNLYLMAFMAEEGKDISQMDSDLEKPFWDALPK